MGDFNCVNGVKGDKGHVIIDAGTIRKVATLKLSTAKGANPDELADPCILYGTGEIDLGGGHVATVMVRINADISTARALGIKLLDPIASPVRTIKPARMTYAAYKALDAAK